MRRWFFLLFASTGLVADTLTLINDSIFHLRAEIYNASGDKEKAITLNPGQTYTWYRNQSPFNTQYDTATSPYTVKWFCTDPQPYNYNPPPPKKNDKGKKDKAAKYQSEFATWTNVPSGATINAQASTNGTTTCVIRKKEKEAPPKNQPPYHKPPGSLGNWDNDGGETWGNDNGPGWETQLLDEENKEE